MSDNASTNGPKWLIVITSVFGLIAALFVVMAKYYEVQKTKAEADKAQLETKQEQARTSAPPPTSPDTTKPSPIPAPSGNAPSTSISRTSTHVSMSSPDDNWMSVFNGSDMKGLKVYRRMDPNAKPWTIQNGELTCVKRNTADQGRLALIEKHRDFRLKFEYRLEPTGRAWVLLHSSGIASIRVKLFGVEPARPELGTGSLWWDDKWGGTPGNVPSDHLAVLQPIGNWNRVEILANGKSISIQVNNNLVLQTDTEVLKKKNIDYSGLSYSDGEIGFENDTSSAFRLRNIELVVLKTIMK